ncbi:hypothetical protein [Marmoricola sp. RAF53]|uniref:hypothetical protein n=1 Tax=Marmoricola sp. RAF53 TaxID=3233059 RepID=UPI003F94BBDA
MVARLRGPRDERGVVAVAVALITCFMLIPLAAYAVDIGVQRVARRDAQSVADLVALDLARLLDGRKYGQLSGGLQAAADKSAARNSGPGGTPTVVPELGTLAGTFDPNNPGANFVKMTDPNLVPTAVRVTVKSSVTFTIMPGRGSVTRTALAKTDSSACYDIGSYSLNLNSQRSALLNALVGDALNLSAITYTGLANANVKLLGLATELNAGTVDELLNLKDLSLNQLYLASARALQKSGGNAANVALLNQLATANLGALPHVKLGDLLNLQSGNNAALGTNLNLLDLVATSAFVANGNNALAIPNLGLNAIPGVLNVTGSLKIVEKPHHTCTSDLVNTSQIDLQLHVTVADLDLLLFRAVTTVDLSLQVGTGTARRTNAFCGNPSGIDVSVGSGLAQLSLSPNIVLKLLGLPLVEVYGGVGTTAPPASTTLQYRNPPDSLGVVKSSGSGVILPQLQLSDLHLNLLGLLPLGVSQAGILSAVLSSIVTPILNPVIAVLNSALLTPLTDLLGLNLGGADVIFKDEPDCTNPVLAG